jgi:hypothetical protein
MNSETVGEIKGKLCGVADAYLWVSPVAVQWIWMSYANTNTIWDNTVAPVLEGKVWVS